MNTGKERINVFRDTLRWVETNPKLNKAVEKAKRKTKIFYDNDYPVLDASRLRDQKVSVSTDRSFQAAIRLKKESPGSRIAVLNFANAFHPGGSVGAGASSQEECLCRCSTLYPLLNRNYLLNNFYDYHEELGTDNASDTVVYMEGVVICKTDEDLPQRMPEEDWVAVDVITAAAPDLNSYPRLLITESPIARPPVEGFNLPEFFDNQPAMSDAALFGYHVKRAIHILTVAAAKGADILVTGAFGCGAFRNDPKVVANAWRTALSVFPKVFERVEFAVYCTDEKMENYRVFRDTFAGSEV